MEKTIKLIAIGITVIILILTIPLSSKKYQIVKPVYYECKIWENKIIDDSLTSHIDSNLWVLDKYQTIIISKLQ